MYTCNLVCRVHTHNVCRGLTLTHSHSATATLQLCNSATLQLCNSATLQLCKFVLFNHSCLTSSIDFSSLHFLFPLALPKLVNTTACNRSMLSFIVSNTTISFSALTFTSSSMAPFISVICVMYGA
jgi:hypothetical protein